MCTCIDYISLPYSRLCLITGNPSNWDDVPDIPDYTKYCTIVAICTITVQLATQPAHANCMSRCILIYKQRYWRFRINWMSGSVPRITSTWKGGSNKLDCGEPITLEAFPRNRADTSAPTPAANNSFRRTAHQRTRSRNDSLCVLENHKMKWKTIPKQPITELEDVSLWIVHPLNHRRMPKEYMNAPPAGRATLNKSKRTPWRDISHTKCRWFPSHHRAQITNPRSSATDTRQYTPSVAC